jgi:hypothetical protein
VKSSRIGIMVIVITVILMWSGFVAALNQDEAAAHANFSEPLLAGQQAIATIFFSSTSADDILITNVGIHFDWLPADRFLGFDLSSAPVNVSSGGSTMFQQMTFQVPTNIASGEHSYFIGVDGTQGLQSTPFSWNSATSTVEIIGGSSSTSPSNTNSGGEQPTDQTNFLLYGVLGVIVAIVVLLIIALLMWKKRKQSKSETDTASSKTETPKSEDKPNSEQDFSI